MTLARRFRAVKSEKFQIPEHAVLSRERKAVHAAELHLEQVVAVPAARQPQVRAQMLQAGAEEEL